MRVTEDQYEQLLATGERAAKRAFAAAKAERAAEIAELGSDGALLCACGDYRSDHPNDGACSLNGLGHGMPSNEPLNKCMAYRPFGDSPKEAEMVATEPESGLAAEKSRKRYQDTPKTSQRAKNAKTASGEAVRLEIRAGAVEKEVQSAICALLAAYRIPYAVTDAAEAYNRRGQRIRRVDPGWPDVTACNPDDGRFIAIECKRAKGGQLRYEQAATLERLHEAGALVIVARSIDDVISAFISAFDTRRTSDATLAEIAAALNRGPKLKRGKL